MVARNQFARFGFKKTTIDEIAKDARIGKSSLYYYFKGKEEIFAEVVKVEAQHLLDALEKTLGRKGTPQQKLRRFILTKIKYAQEQANFNELTEEAALEFQPYLAAGLEEYNKKELTLVEEILKKGVDQGIFSIENPRVVALAMLSALKELGFPWILDRKVVNVEKGVDILLNLFFKGIETR